MRRRDSRVMDRVRSLGCRRLVKQNREIIADNLSKAGWSWGCIASVDSEGRTIYIADAHRDNGKRYVVHADDKLTAFVELERAICIHLSSEQI